MPTKSDAAYRPSKLTTGPSATTNAAQQAAKRAILERMELDLLRLLFEEHDPSVLASLQEAHFQITQALNPSRTGGSVVL